jgi:hypothetical protein
VRIVYLARGDFLDPPPPFRTGEAGTVRLGEGGAIESDTRVVLSANSTHALLGHGVVDALNRLPLQGVVGSGLDVLIPQSQLDRAQRLFYEADRKTYARSWEFVAGRTGDAAPVEYRVRIDNREYQSTLARLTFLLGSAGREGWAVRLRI